MFTNSVIDSRIQQSIKKNAIKDTTAPLVSLITLFVGFIIGYPLLNSAAALGIIVIIAIPATSTVFVLRKRKKQIMEITQSFYTSIEKNRAYSVDVLEKSLAESLFTFFMVTRSVINEILRSALRRLHSKGLVNAESSLCLIRHATRLLDGRERTLTEKHYLTQKEREDYLQLQKLMEQRYQVDIRKLFYAKSDTMDKARDDFQEEMEKFVVACGYETYVTSNIITITELGLTEKLGNSEESRNMLKMAIGTSIIDRCRSELTLAMPSELLESFFVDYLNIHLDSI